MIYRSSDLDRFEMAAQGDLPISQILISMAKAKTSYMPQP